MLKDNKDLCLILKIIVITSKFFRMTSIEIVFLYIVHIWYKIYIYMRFVRKLYISLKIAFIEVI